MHRYLLIFICLLAGCETKKTTSYEVVLKDKFSTSIPIEFSTPFSTTVKGDKAIFISNLSNKILVLDKEDFSNDSLIEIPDFEVSDISTLSLNPFNNSVIGHSEKRNGFIEYVGGKTKFYPLNQSEFFLIDNRKTSGHFISDSRMILSLVKGNLSLFPPEMIDDQLTTFGIYDFDQKKVVDFFGSYPKEILDAKGKYPKEFQIPFNLLHHEMLLVGYPLSDEVISYDVNNINTYQSKKVDSDYFKLPSPFSDGEDRSEVFKLFYYSNHYGPISYHKDLDIYSRVLIHELPLNSKDACSRRYSLILFDKNLEKLDEIEVTNIYNADWSFALSTPSGFMLPGKCENYQGEDYYIYNAYVDIVEK